MIVVLDSGFVGNDPLCLLILITTIYSGLPGEYFLKKNYFCSSVLQELRESQFSNSICMGEFL